MKVWKASTAICAVAALSFFTATGRAGRWDKKTGVQVSESLRIPGTVLMPGTYVFKQVVLPPIVMSCRSRMPTKPK
jgi:hypothetical protein